MLSRLLREVIFTLIHVVLSLVTLVHNVRRRFWTKQWYYREKSVTKKDVELLVTRLQKAGPTLKHLVVADAGLLSCTDLARVLIWSLVAGVPYVSFYDITGSLEKHDEEFFLEVERNKKGIPGCIKWAKKPDLNGYSNGAQAYTVIVNIFNKSSGRNRIAQCIKDIAQGRISCQRRLKEFTSQELDKSISSVYLPLPDPDLVMYTGPLCCTHGLLPWHIRLSEFIQLSPDNSLSVFDYINAINKYKKCDQRFGT